MFLLEVNLCRCFLYTSQIKLVRTKLRSRIKLPSLVATNECVERWDARESVAASWKKTRSSVVTIICCRKRWSAQWLTRWVADDRCLWGETDTEGASHASGADLAEGWRCADLADSCRSSDFFTDATRWLLCSSFGAAGRERWVRCDCCLFSFCRCSCRWYCWP